MSDSIKDPKSVERQLRRLFNIIVEEADKNADFAARLAKVLGPSEATHSSQNVEPRPAAFNPVDILHREGKEALQSQLEMRTDTELKAILRQQGLWRRKGGKAAL